MKGSPRRVRLHIHSRNSFSLRKISIFGGPAAVLPEFSLSNTWRLDEPCFSLQVQLAQICQGSATLEDNYGYYKIDHLSNGQKLAGIDSSNGAHQRASPILIAVNTVSTNKNPGPIQLIQAKGASLGSNIKFPLDSTVFPGDHPENSSPTAENHKNVMR